jgi:hypothetical protein
MVRRRSFGLSSEQEIDLLMVTMSEEFEGRSRGPLLLICLIGPTVLLFLLGERYVAIDEVVRSNGGAVS